MVGASWEHELDPSSHYGGHGRKTVLSARRCWTKKKTLTKRRMASETLDRNAKERKKKRVSLTKANQQLYCFIGVRKVELVDFFLFRSHSKAAAAVRDRTSVL